MCDVVGDLTFEYLTKLRVQTKLTNFGTIVVMACEIAKYDNIEKYNMISPRFFGDEINWL